MEDKTLDRELDKHKKMVVAEAMVTDLKKGHFINEVKSGLGNAIKRNPGKVKIIKKTFGERLMIGLKKIFTKF